MANLLDRLLQFELDRRERINSRGIPAIRGDLEDSASGVELNFIDDSSLNRWREFVSVVTSRKLSRDDFRTFVERYLVWTRQIAPERLESFFASFDAELASVLEIVPEETVQGFREQSVADSVRVAGEYLG